MSRELYRALLREARTLPDRNSAAFYKARIQASFRLAVVPEASLTAIKRLDGAERLLRQLQAANDGYLHALTRVLDHTYGRRGASKQALLRPFTTPTQTPGVLHPFSTGLAALVTSSIAHTSKAPSKATLLSPPRLPPRAFPGSEEARLLGPLSPARINKIHLRYRNEQVGKVNAPVAVLLKQKGVPVDEEQARLVLERTGLPELQLGSAMLDELERRTQVPLEMRPRVPRRLQGDYEYPPSVQPVGHFSSAPLRVHIPSPRTSKWKAPREITPRLLRRRYKIMLEDAPIVTATLAETDPTKEGDAKVSFGVTRSTWANKGVSHLPVMDAEDLWWLAGDPVKPKRGKP